MIRNGLRLLSQSANCFLFWNLGRTGGAEVNCKINLKHFDVKLDYLFPFKYSTEVENYELKYVNFTYTKKRYIFQKLNWGNYDASQG